MFKVVKTYKKSTELSVAKTQVYKGAFNLLGSKDI